MKAYAPSQSANQNLACKIVRVGNASLYFWAYTKGTVLNISGWRSVDPSQARILPRAKGLKIVQGNVVKESLTMLLLEKMPGGPDQWIDGRSSGGQPMTDIVVGMMRTGVNMWDVMTSIMSERKLPKSLKLDQVKIPGFVAT